MRYYLENADTRSYKQVFADSLYSFKPDDYIWGFYMYESLKTSDGTVLDFARIKMEGIQPLLEALKEHIITKALSSRPVGIYDPLRPKEAIGAVGSDDPIVKGALADAMLCMDNAQDWQAEELEYSDAKWAGYAFYGKQESEENSGKSVLIMKRANPIQPLLKSSFFVSNGESLAETSESILKFTPALDLCVIDGMCYFFSDALARDFDMQGRDRAQAVKCLKIIEESGLVSDMHTFSEAAMKPKNSKKFHDFDEGILSHIARIEIADRIDFLQSYGVALDGGGLLSSYTDEECAYIIDLITSRSCIDPLGRLSFGKIAPREA